MWYLTLNNLCVCVFEFRYLAEKLSLSVCANILYASVCVCVSKWVRHHCSAEEALNFTWKKDEFGFVIVSNFYCVWVQPLNQNLWQNVTFFSAEESKEIKIIWGNKENEKKESSTLSAPPIVRCQT